ncbi:MAG TPA: DUF2934 domain-containing protein [Planctomycetota bacterium]|nr:DUF2934 domain-containing protein [Planctomycetota bacterium]
MADKKAVPKKAEAKASASAGGAAAKPAPAPMKPAPAAAAKAAPAAPAPTAVKPAATAKPTAAERQRRIAEAAYFLAQRRGFAPGGAVQDWLTAERNVDAAILRGT